MKRILVIEDDDSIRESTRDLLELEGYSVWSARNGEEGLALLREVAQLPDLILLDLMMPVKDGYDFRRDQRADARVADVPVVIWSAHGPGDEAHETLEANDFIPKSADWKTVLGVVRRWCP